MNELHGFELIAEKAVTELKLTAQHFRHIKTGAELLSLQNDDENKSFGITFRTPPPDSTGVAHILEHSVLCGSRRYPVKEPFIELAKGSLKTFLNAMTGEGQTYYPVASTNRQDFYNLINVYLDCVFYPRLTRHTFEQEGWHYELDDPAQPLTYKGVVFNEMKGYYASPDVRLYRYADLAIFPDNAYGEDSGGDPRVIPDLTYEAFKNFHETYYHPSNARIVFHGDDDPVERLRFMNEWLQDFDPREIDSLIPLQPRLNEPRQFEFPYPVEEESPNADKAHVLISWLLSTELDVDQMLALGFFNYVLIATPASPLRKALIDSGLGEEVTGGVGGDRQHAFSVGLKGIATDASGAVYEVVDKTLRELVKNGVDPLTIEAALNTIEFSLRENNTGSFPRGLSLMMNSLRLWLFGGDPIAAISFEAPLERLKKRLASGERVVEDLIANELLNNSHRTTVTLQPDPQLAQQENEVERQRLEEARRRMSEEDIQRIIADTAELKRLQEAPDSPEALATIPSLKLSDLDRKNKQIPRENIEVGGVPVLYHDLFTNGIVYTNFGFDLHKLPQDLLPYVPLFGRALTQMGTEREDFVRLIQRIGGKTGGVWANSFNSVVRDSPRSTSWLFVSAKALPTQIDDTLAIMRDILTTPRLDNQERFRQMALEEKARLESRLGFGAAGFVSARLGSRFHEAGWLNEQMSGISYLFFVRKLVDEINSNWPAVLSQLERIRELLIDGGSMLGNVTTDRDTWNQFEPRYAAFLHNLPGSTGVNVSWQVSPPKQDEGMTMPTQVNSVGKAVNLYDLGYSYSGSVEVITNYLGTTWMWDQVRVKGGAYGAHCRFNDLSGVFSFMSSQDPNLLGTIDVYDNTSKFLRDLEINDQEVTRSIIGAISDIDSYQLPDAKGWTSMVRYLVGETDEMLQKMRDEVLTTTADDFHNFAGVIEGIRDLGKTVVLGSPEAVNQANEQRGNPFEVISVI